MGCNIFCTFHKNRVIFNSLIFLVTAVATHHDITIFYIIKHDTYLIQ